MIDLSEPPLPLKEASQLFPGHPHTTTIARWGHAGVRGHRLSLIRSGGRLFVTRSAVEQFLDALAESDGREGSV